MLRNKQIKYLQVEDDSLIRAMLMLVVVAIGYILNLISFFPIFMSNLGFLAKGHMVCCLLVASHFDPSYIPRKEKPIKNSI